jgi:DnaK suppressor protein
LLDDAARAEIKDHIRQEIEHLAEEIKKLQEQTKPVAPDRAIGRLTRMEAIQSKSISEANLRKAQQRTKALKRALPLVDDEEYGECERCGRYIPLKRLLLVPESKFCVRCLERR